ncbi:unnamed protein product [Cylindrotheca closterium]|uniref:Selenoprotein W n=1 Tax=Cylindrotheca closterium TaxID=2856 RepID=A0AAD2FBE5_9STRA|nr:unnamed protein product [Cylindrotheca closterium]
MKLLLFVCSLLLGRVSPFQTTPAHFALPKKHSTTLLHTANDDAETTSQRISIEYCTGCRWMLRAFWNAQELLSTFEKDLDSITIVPSSSKGIFVVRLNGESLVWDRKENDGFPSPKELKQVVRDLVKPDKFLGHSDTEERQSSDSENGDSVVDTSTAVESTPVYVADESPSITITYCTGCKWLLRAAYYGQELLTTFDTEIKSVTLVPSKAVKGGEFSVHLDGNLLFDRKTDGGFPETKELKQMIRDVVSPSKDLGHSDVEEEVSDEDSAEQRRFFGVD